MRLFQPNKKFTTIAVYVAAVCMIATLGVLLIFRFSEFLSFLSKILSVLSPVLYGLLFAYFCLPILRFYENRVFKRLHMQKIEDAQRIMETATDEDAFKIARHTVHVYRSRRRMLTISLTYLTVFLLIGGFLMLLIPMIGNEYTQFSGKISEYVMKAINWIQQTFSKFVGQIEAESITSVFQSFLSSILFGTANLISGVILAPYNILLGFVVSCYLLLRKERMLRNTKRLAAAIIPKKRLSRWIDIARFADKTFGKYLIGKVFEALIVGILFFVILIIFRFPYASLVSVIMMITNLIPVFGVYIGCVPGALLICTENPILALWFLLITIVITQLDGAVIGPKVIGNAVGLSGLWIIVSITLMGGLFGIPGMVFGAPIFSILYSVIRSKVNKRLMSKGLATDSSEYEEMFSSDKILPTRQTRRVLSVLRRKRSYTDDDSLGGDEI